MDHLRKSKTGLCRPTDEEKHKLFKPPTADITPYGQKNPMKWYHNCG